ncbi:DUF2625 family protein [[Clostridium] spiroforme]|nr:DUF2625 family protein [Thomasclavelia spiroformis]MBM6879555.1 DUF2625 family protein [Thomasclavelia spiroformis]
MKEGADMKYISSETLLDSWIHEGANEGFPRTENRFDSSLNLTSKSILGLMLAKYSMITVIEKRIRFFGGDNRIRSSLEEINGITADQREKVPDILVIADDICGGIFAINNGFVSNIHPGNVMFLPYNSLSFENLEIGHADFVHWCMTCSYNDWLKNSWKTSEKEMADLKKADDYVMAKLRAVRDLKEECM